MRNGSKGVEAGPIDDLEWQLARALEAVPEVQVPADFAARVASRVPARRPVVFKQTYVGRNIMVLSLIALFAALLVLAPLTEKGSILWTSLEWTLCGQFTLLALWLTFRKQLWR